MSFAFPKEIIITKTFQLINGNNPTQTITFDPNISDKFTSQQFVSILNSTFPDAGFVLEDDQYLTEENGKNIFMEKSGGGAMDGSFNILGNLDVSGFATINGNSIFNGSVDINGNIESSSNFSLGKVLTLYDALNISGGGLKDINDPTYGDKPILIGNNVNIGSINKPKSSITIGNNSGISRSGTQGEQTIAIGNYVGFSQQGAGSIGLGYFSAHTSQGNYSLSIGYYDDISGGQTSQGSDAISFGRNSGYSVQGSDAIAIGHNTGRNNQAPYSIALGYNSGYSGQETNSIAIGNKSAYNIQGIQSISIGAYQEDDKDTVAGQINQKTHSISIGRNAGKIDQENNSIAIGYLAARYKQSNSAISIGNYWDTDSSGQLNQGAYAISLGKDTGKYDQGVKSIAIGFAAGMGSITNDTDSQATQSIALGTNAGKINQGGTSGYSTAIGYKSGETDQGEYSLAFGTNAALTSQGNYSIALGSSSGATSQGAYSIALGANAGLTSQGANSLAFGSNSGHTSQGAYSVAIGDQAGRTSQGLHSIAIGDQAANSSQSTYSIAIGDQAGNANQKQKNIAIGNQAGFSTQGKATDGDGGFSIAIGNASGQTDQNEYSIAIGSNAGNSTQLNSAIAIGRDAGKTSQQNSTIALGYKSGETTQGAYSIALGTEAGNSAQGGYAIAIGAEAGETTQGGSSIALGFQSGYSNQSTNSVAIGREAGKTSQSSDAVSIGNYVDSGNSGGGQSNQGQHSISIGTNSGSTNQATNSVSIGRDSGKNNQGSSAVSIGYGAGLTSQGVNSLAIGEGSGKYHQGDYSVAIGQQCGQGDGTTNNQQGTKSVAIGWTSGKINQGVESLAIGTSTGVNNQGANCIALGTRSGKETQGSNSISIGRDAGTESQSANSIALGTNAGKNTQGNNSIAIGFKAGEGIQGGQGQHNNTIIFNSENNALNSDGENRLFIKPIRNVTTTTTNTDTILRYNQTTGEIMHHKDLNMPANSRIMFNNAGTNAFNSGPNMIKLWNNEQYGFGIDTSTLKYCSATHHKFYYSTSGSSNGTLGMHLNSSDLTVTGKVGVNNITPTYELDIKGISHTGAEGFHSGRILHYYSLNSLTGFHSVANDVGRGDSVMVINNDYIQIKNSSYLRSPSLDITGYSTFKENGTYTSNNIGGYTSQRILVKLSAAFYSQDSNTDYFSIQLLNGSDNTLIAEIYKVYNATQTNSIGFNPIVCDITPFLSETIGSIKIKLISNQTSLGGSDIVHVKNLTVCVDDTTPWYQFSAKQATFTDKVGIGTTDPSANLHISSGNNGDCTLILEADTGNSNEHNNPQIVFRQDGGKDWSAIGHTNGANNALILSNSVNGGSGGILFNTNNSINGYTTAIERMRINDVGNVGIGTTSPSAKLEVVGDTTLDDVMITAGKTIYFQQAEKTTGMQITSTRIKGQLNTSLFLDSRPNGDNEGIIFKTNDDIRMLLSRYGRLRIGTGTTVPLVQLEISGTDAIKIPVGTTGQRPTATGTSHYGYIRYNTDNSSYEGFGAGNAWGSLGGVKDVDQDTYISAETSAGADNDQLKFFTANSERMIIHSNGNVGIGANIPGAKLDVNGSIKLSGSLFAGTNEITSTQLGYLSNGYHEADLTQIFTPSSSTAQFGNIIKGMAVTKIRIETVNGSSGHWSLGHVDVFDFDGNNLVQTSNNGFTAKLFYASNDTEITNSNYGSYGLNGNWGRVANIIASSLSSQYYWNGNGMGNTSYWFLGLKENMYVEIYFPSGVTDINEITVGPWNQYSFADRFGDQTKITTFNGSTQLTTYTLPSAASASYNFYVLTPTASYSSAVTTFISNYPNSSNLTNIITDHEPSLVSNYKMLQLSDTSTTIGTINLIPNSISGAKVGINSLFDDITHTLTVGGDIKLTGSLVNNSNVSISSTELGHLNNVSSNIQTQLNTLTTDVASAGKWSDGATSGEIYYNSGKVGIGTNNPASVLTIDTASNWDGLQLFNGTIPFAKIVKTSSSLNSGHFVLFHDSAANVNFSADPGRFSYINNGNNFGIGTATPSCELDVSGNIKLTGDLITSSKTISQAELGYLDGVTGPIQAQLTAAAAGGGKWTDGTTSGMICYNSGNVGIGTTNPQQKLEVAGNILLGANDVDSFIHSGGNGAFSADGELRLVADSNDTTGAGGQDLIFGYGSNVNMNGVRNTSFPSSFPRVETMRIKSSNSYVGIGTNTPSSKLDVNGDINITGSGRLKMDGVELVGNSNNGNPVDLWYNCRVIHNTSRTDGMWINYNSSGTTAADLRFYANGNNLRMIIKANIGNVGIGTDAPNANAKLDVDGSIRGAYDTSTTSYFGRAAIGYCGHSDWASFSHINRNNGSDYSLMHSSSGKTLLNAKSGQSINFKINNADKMMLSSNGNFGIGTTSPEEKLHVAGNIKLTGSLITSSKTISQAELNQLDGINTNQTIQAQINAASGSGGGAFTTSGTSCYFNGAGGVNIGENNAPSARLEINDSAGRSIRFGTSSSSNVHHMDYYSGNDQSNPFHINHYSGEDVIICAGTQGGNVGIGKTNPSAKLDVGGSIRADFDTVTTSYFGRAAIGGHLSYNDWASFSHLDKVSAGNYALLHSKDGATILNASSDQPMKFRNNNNDKMILSSNGNFGIGTSSPTEKLDVGGSINITGSGVLKMDGFELIQNLNNDANSDLRYNCRVIGNITGTNGMYINFDSAGGDTADCRFYANGTTSRMMIKANSGNVGIGTTVPTHKLHVNGSAQATSFNATSDVRHKENICDLDRALEKICAIRGVNYTFKTDKDKNMHAGILAQEVADIIPEAICKTDDDMWSANYNTLIGYLIESVKTLKAENDAKDAQITILKTSGHNLENTVTHLNNTIEIMTNDISAIKSALNM
jgi:hypothetical protein